MIKMYFIKRHQRGLKQTCVISQIPEDTCVLLLSLRLYQNHQLAHFLRVFLQVPSFSLLLQHCTSNWIFLVAADWPPVSPLMISIWACLLLEVVGCFTITYPSNSYQKSQPILSSQSDQFSNLKKRLNCQYRMMSSWGEMQNAVVTGRGVRKRMAGKFHLCFSQIIKMHSSQERFPQHERLQLKENIPNAQEGGISFQKCYS